MLNNSLEPFTGVGLALVPIPQINGKPTKGPRAKGWNLPRATDNPNGYSSRLDDFSACDNAFNFGLYHGASNTLALDLDDVALARKVFDELTDIQLLDWLESEQRAEVKSPKANRGKLLFKLPAGFTGAGLRQLKHGSKTVFELRSGNCQDVIYGQHPEGGFYQFVGNPAAIPEAPAVLLDMLQHWDAWKLCFDSALGIEQIPPTNAPQRPQQGGQMPGRRDPIQTFNQSKGVAAVLLSNGYRQVGMDRFTRPGSESKAPGAVIMRNCTDGIERIYSHGGDILNDGFAHDAFDVFCLLECAGDFNAALKWNPEITKHNQQIFMHEQAKNAKTGSTSLQPVFNAPALSGTDARDGTESTRPLSELGNAERLLDAHGGDIHYVHDAKAWLHWRGGAWSWDVDGAAVRGLATLLPQQIYSEGVLHLADAEYFAKWSRTSQKERTVLATVSLLQDIDRVRLPLSCVDADLFKVGFDHAKQVLDLRTGKARAARQEDLITKSLSVDRLGDSSKALLWRAFLTQIFGDDVELIDWVKRWCGYMLTGSTSEQILVFCFGLGANGKSVLGDILRHILCDYARAIASETLTESKRTAGSATPDLAELIGARMAMSAETEDGAALAESLIKSLVSGDTMTVRKLYTAPVQFTPQFKLMMLGNHKPIIKGNDHGIWRRVRLLPFRRTFKPEERDAGLSEKLKVEAPHILAWMVEGCIDWQQRGA